jgi:hypothetical protein
MNTGLLLHFAGPGSWLPGARDEPVPGNDDHLRNNGNAR